MKLCFIADYASPTAVAWIAHFAQRGHEVHVISTHICNLRTAGVRVHNLMTEREQTARSVLRGSALGGINLSSLAGRSLMGLWQSVILPIRIGAYARAARRIVLQIQPDLVHCLRIPIEGEIGSLIDFCPIVFSIWGNDFTLYAQRSRFHRAMTRHALSRAAALLADCQVDIMRATNFGLRSSVPVLVVPGGGGVKPDQFFRGPGPAGLRARLGIPSDAPVVLSSRGVRAYVRHDTFFAALPLVCRRFPDVRFVCVGLKGWASAENWVSRYKLQRNVILTPPWAQSELPDLYRQASAFISLTEHDGTPNSLLEAMACGCLPICGDLPSIREWISDKENGLLVDPSRADEVGAALTRALVDRDLRAKASGINARIVAERATYPSCMSPVEELYRAVGSERMKPTPERQFFGGPSG